MQLMAVALLSKCDWPSKNHQNKEKVFRWSSNILESLESICSEHIINFSIPLNFTHFKIRIVNPDE